MSVIAIFYADQALRLAHERSEQYRSEAEIDRMVAAANAHGPRFGAIKAALASLRTAIARIDPEPSRALPSLIDYPYRG